MSEKRILIADPDPKACEELRRALGNSWVVVGAQSNSAALAAIETQSFEVVLANYNLPEAGGADLLNRLRISHPKTLRFIASPEAQKENIMAHVLGGHQFLAVPFEHATLKLSIERSLEADYGMNASMRELVGRIRTFPTIPSLYVEVVNALKDPNATTEDIGAIIGKDMAMTTKLVQVLNSAYFGLPRSITDPTEAVGILGFETVTSLIMTVKMLSQYDKVKPVYFSIDNIWKHSTNVARTAKILAQMETVDTDCSSTAYTAGLMHDLGKVILAANFDSQYQGAHALSRKQQIPLWEVEKDIFGATHGEIGAYLLGLWGMSSDVLKVAAMHHHPIRAGDTAFSSLTAVHVANALEYEDAPDPEGLPAAAIDTAYLQELGLAERVESWREARRDPESTKFETKKQRSKSGAKSASVAPASKAERFAPAAAPPPPLIAPGMSKWLGIGLAVSAVVALLAWLQVKHLQGSVEKPEFQVVAKPKAEPGKNEQVAVAPPAKPPVEANPTPVAPSKPPLTVIQPVPAPVATPAAPPPSPAKVALGKLKLEMILYSSNNAVARINGQLAKEDQEVGGCRVVKIGPSFVTVAYDNEQRTLRLTQ